MGTTLYGIFSKGERGSGARFLLGPSSIEFGLNSLTSASARSSPPGRGLGTEDFYRIQLLWKMWDIQVQVSDVTNVYKRNIFFP